MWILNNLHTHERICLLPEKKKYTVGRSATDIELHDDSSVSRSHAVLHVKSQLNGPFSLELEDTGSKYGTFLNKNIETNKPVIIGKCTQLKMGDCVRIGRLKNVWKIEEWSPTTITSSLNANEQNEVADLLRSLGGRVLNKFSLDSTYKYLTMNEPSITIKLLHALIEQKEIVTIDYWKAILKVMRITSLPQPLSYRPCFEKDIDINCRIERKTIFNGWTFVFLHKKQYDIYGPLVQLAGALYKDLNTGIQKTFLIKSNVIVIQYTPATQTQSSPSINAIADYLQNHSRRIIPEYEIGLAILHCSTEKYCNPSYNSTKNPIALVTEEELHNNGTEIPETSVNNAFSTHFPDLQSINNEGYMPESDKEYLSNITISETPLEKINTCKRKSQTTVEMNESDDDESDDGHLFQFPKRNCNQFERSLSSITSDNANGNLTLNHRLKKNVENKSENFLQKDNKSTIKTIEHYSSNNYQETGKRKRLEIIDENNVDMDNLFDFDDSQPLLINKEMKNSYDDCIKPNHLLNSNGSDIDKRSVTIPQKCVNITPTNDRLYPLQKEKLQPKKLPRTVDVSTWLSCSLKINEKPFDNIDINDNVNSTHPQQIIKYETEIKKDNDDIMHDKWENSLRDVFTIQKLSLKDTIRTDLYDQQNNIKYKNSNDKYLSQNQTNVSSVKNFKAFVKKYHRPQHTHGLEIRLHSYVV